MNETIIILYGKLVDLKLGPIEARIDTGGPWFDAAIALAIVLAAVAVGCFYLAKRNTP